jgi:hypothetical protein
MIDIIFESRTIKEMLKRFNEVYTEEGVNYLADAFSGSSPSMREVSAAAIDYCNAWKSTFDDNVYLLTAPNGKKYAGQSATLKTRFRDYKQGRGSNQHLSRALKKYGLDKFEIVYYTIPTACADIIEKFMILWYKLMNKDKGYNKQSGGKHGWMTSNETRAKMSAAQLGEKNHFFGKTHDKKTRAKMSILISATMTKERRAKISASMSGEKNHWFGKKHSQETCAKIGAANSGEKNHWFGKKFSVDHRKKMSVSKTGEKHFRTYPVVVNGCLYPTATEASEKQYPNYKNNYVKNYISRPRYKNSTKIFKVSKDFYAECHQNSITENITHEMYERFNQGMEQL